MLSRPEVCRLGSLLKLTTPTGEQIVLREVSAAIQVDGPKLSGFQISFLASPETYKTIQTYGLFNYKDSSQSPSVSQEEHKHIEVRLAPELLPIVQQNASDVFDAAVYMRHQSRSTPISPLCQTQNWHVSSRPVAP